MLSLITYTHVWRTEGGPRQFSCRVTIACLLVGLLLSSGDAQGDYNNPPDWDSNPYFTHQSWEFVSDASPLLPDSCEHPLQNPFGDPVGEIITPSEGAYSATWIGNVNEWLPDSDRFGAWGFIANIPEGTYDALEFVIPNEANENLVKEVWLQATMWTSNYRGEDPGEIYARLLDAQGNVYDYTTRNIEFFGSAVMGAPWVHVTYQFEMDPQPPLERIVLGAHLLEGEVIVLDQVDIDTRCIPSAPTADYNSDGIVDLADYTVWRNFLGASGLPPYDFGDGNGDGNVTVADYDVWKSQFGMTAATTVISSSSVPEPSAMATLLCLAACVWTVRW